MSLAKNIELIAIEEAILVNNGDMEEGERLGTFAFWKKAGRVIKRGEKSIARFPVWTKGKSYEDENGEYHAGGFYMKQTCFFKTSQTITREEAKNLGYKIR